MAIETEWAQMSNEDVREDLSQLVKLIFMDINRFERMKRDLEIIVEDYNTSKSPEGLLFSVSRTLTVADWIAPEIREIGDDFRDALNRYYDGDVKSLGEAFGVRRRKGWRQLSQNFEKKNRTDIESAIDNLAEQGVMKPESFEVVGQKYGKSSGTIQNIYYSLRRAKLTFADFKENLESKRTNPKHTRETLYQTPTMEALANIYFLLGEFLSKSKNK